MEKFVSENMKKSRLLFYTVIFIFFIGVAYIFSNRIEKKETLASCVKNLICTDCNIILISIDSLNASHIGALGYERDTTPFLDSLSSKGYLFKNYFTTSYLTPITQLSLFTSLYPSSIGVRNFFPKLAQDKLTMAQILKKEGYYTQAITSSPEYIDTPDKESFYRGFDRYVFTQPRKLPRKKLVDKELEKLKDKQFFLWLTVSTIHWPYDNHEINIFSDPKYNGFFKNNSLDSKTFNRIYQDNYYASDGRKIPITKNDIKYVIDNYDNGVREFDKYLNYFYKLLEAKKLTEKSIIILTSEHGESLYEYGYFIHYDILKNTVHTPLLFLLPYKKNTGLIDKLASTVDILPTVLNLIGRSAPLQTQGSSLTEYICGEKPPEDDNVFIERSPTWEYITMDNNQIEEWRKKFGIDVFQTNFDSAVRTERWKYIERSSKNVLEKISVFKGLTGKPILISDEELYDLENDPLEKINIAPDKPEIVKELKLKLKNWQKQYRQNQQEKLNKEILPLQEYF
jgi:arylsulfatase A-like enzyme